MLLLIILSLTPVTVSWPWLSSSCVPYREWFEVGWQSYIEIADSARQTLENYLSDPTCQDTTFVENLFIDIFGINPATHRDRYNFVKYLIGRDSILVFTLDANYS